MIEHVDVEAAREAGGVRMVISGIPSSPWSEVAKGVIHVAVMEHRREMFDGHLRWPIAI